MTTLDKNQPYICVYRVSNGQLTTVCDTQCDECKKYEDLKSSYSDKTTE